MAFVRSFFGLSVPGKEVWGNREDQNYRIEDSLALWHMETGKHTRWGREERRGEERRLCEYI